MDDNGDNGPVTLGVIWSLCAFSGLFLGLRLYAKLSRHSRLWWDDYMIALAWVILLATSCIAQISRKYGLGKHIWTMNIEDAFILARNTYIGATVSCFAATFSKISFGITLLRLTKGPLKAFVWFSIISLFIVMLPSAFLTWVSCRPTAKLYNPFLAGECWPPHVIRNYGYFNAAFCALIDFALALIPWKILYGLQLQTKEKVGVGIAMSMGLLAGVCAIIKALHLQSTTDFDFFYTGKDLTIWTAVETATAIVGACIPVLRVFFKNTLSSFHDRYQRTDKQSVTDGFTGNTSAVEPVEMVPQKSLTGTSVSSIPGVNDLGMVVSNGFGGIVQTNTVTVAFAPNAQGRIVEWREPVPPHYQ